MNTIIIAVFFSFLVLAVLLITLSWCRTNSRRDMHEMMRRYIEENREYYNHETD